MRIQVRVFATFITMALVLAPAVILLTGFWHNTGHYTLAHNSYWEKVSRKMYYQANPYLWRDHWRSTCRHMGFKNTTNIPQSILKRIIVDDKYKVLYCPIPKVASTTWRRIFIYLAGHATKENLTSIIPSDVYEKYGKSLKRLYHYTTDEINHRVKNYFKFVFVREPYERILSAFRNKFYTNTNSSNYFKKAFGVKIVKQYRRSDSLFNESVGVQFPEFVDYLLDTEKTIAMNEHWDKFYQLCAPCLLKYNFVGKLETIEADFEYIISQISTDKSITLPSRSELKYSYNKTNEIMTRFYSELSTKHILHIYEMYRKDFLLFNYSIPNDILNILVQSKSFETAQTNDKHVLSNIYT